MPMNQLWTRYVLVFLSFWLVAGACTFEYKSAAVYRSDFLSGSCLLFFSLSTFKWKSQWPFWGACFVGVWLQLAPVFLWAPDAFIYLNDTLIGALIIGCSVLIPTFKQDSIEEGGELPLGWNYNPSSWLRRLPIIILATVGWFAARYMAAYQMGYIHTIWDPVFENGTLNVITSDLSRHFPISDAGLGTVCYTLEVLMGCKGSAKRWHTMPWIVVLFGILVIPLGIISTLLIMSQPMLVGSWCAWCLLTALCMLVMVALTMDEIIAVLQYLSQVKKEGKSLWKYFWKGGVLDLPFEREAVIENHFIRESFRGLSFSWRLFVSSLLGIYVMFMDSNAHHILGALCVVVSVVSMADIIRKISYLNATLGIALMGAAGFGIVEPVLTFIVGCILIVLAIPTRKCSRCF